MLTVKTLDSAVEALRREQPDTMDWDVTVEPNIDGTFRIAATRSNTSVHIGTVNILRRHVG